MSAVTSVLNATCVLKYDDQVSKLLIQHGRGNISNQHEFGYHCGFCRALHRKLDKRALANAKISSKKPKSNIP